MAVSIIPGKGLCVVCFVAGDAVREFYFSIVRWMVIMEMLWPFFLYFVAEKKRKRDAVNFM